MRHFDVVIVGTGSGNTILDERFDGLNVALVEHGAFGGTCLNVGCIPSKMYVYASDVAELVRHAGSYGVDATIDKVRWPDIRDRVFGRIDPIAAAGQRYRVQDNPNVTVYPSNAHFVGYKQLDTGAGETVTADQFVLAAGARPHIPAVVANSPVGYETSDTVMRIEQLPERLVILGGGYIAAEFAHIFGALGVQVSIVARGGGLLRHHDEAVSARFTELARQRWDVHLGQPPDRLDSDGDGVRVRLADGRTVASDLLLVATGRIPNSDRLDVAASGVATHPDGRIAVDEQQRSSVEGIFALGDVCSPHQLKHVANHEARVVAHNLIDPEHPRTTDHRRIPHAVFTEPQIAAVGLSEADCRARGLDYATATTAYGEIAYGWAMEDTTGFAKILADRSTGQLLGAHIMGPQASTVIQPLVQAMAFGQPAHEIARGQYWIHPALPEVVENVLLQFPTP